MYAKVDSGVPVSTRSRPNWRNDDGTLVSDDTLIANGYYPVVDSPPALFNKGTQWLERLPQDQWHVKADRVEVAYKVTDKSLAEVIAERVRVITQRYQTVLNGGFTYDFGTTKNATLPDGSTEPAGVRVLQTRQFDRERWQATMQVAQQYIMAGAPTEPMRPFRTEDNASIPMTAQDVADCLNAMQAFFGQALDALWAHKDAVRSLTTVGDVVAYDHTTGWE